MQEYFRQQLTVRQGGLYASPWLHLPWPHQEEDWSPGWFRGTWRCEGSQWFQDSQHRGHMQVWAAFRWAWHYKPSKSLANKTASWSGNYSPFLSQPYAIEKDLIEYVRINPNVGPQAMPLECPHLTCQMLFAGKVVTRGFYERNKHIFPASKWQILTDLWGSIAWRLPQTFVRLFISSSLHVSPHVFWYQMVWHPPLCRGRCFLLGLIFVLSISSSRVPSLNHVGRF